jgi:hypothetical protein
MGDDGVNVFGHLNSISSLPSGDLGEDGSFISGRELGRAAIIKNLSIRKEILEDPGDGGPAKTKFGGNTTCGETIGSKGEDVFLLSRGDGMHVEFGDHGNAGPS